MLELFGLNPPAVDIYWGAIERLWFFPFFAFAFFLFIRHFMQTKKFTSALAHKTHQATLLHYFSHSKQLAKVIASCAALVFLFIALLQPQWHKTEETVMQEGRDLLVLLDISRSMLAQDLKPNRLEFIKLKLKGLLQKLHFERVGLILFSGSAFVQCPLTTDYQTFVMFLDEVSVENIASGTTAIDAALQKAVSTYEQYPSGFNPPTVGLNPTTDRKNKLTLLVTDGEDFSLNLQKIKEQARKAQIRIFALGAGTPEGAPIPIFDARGNQIGHEVDSSGSIVLSKLNEKLLKSVSGSFNGHYIRATYDDSDLNYLVSLIENFEKETFGDKKLSLYQDQYPWFLGASWFLLALAWIL